MGDEDAQATRQEEIVACLQEIAIRVVELLLDWDEDSNGLTDRTEFQKALPVLEIHVSREEGQALFDRLSPDGETIEHWALFRKLADKPGVDLEAAEAEARKSLEAVQTKRQLSEATPFWSRETGGKSVNRHSLRKRSIALQPWEKKWTDPNSAWTGGLRTEGSTLADSELNEEEHGHVNARQLQGSVVLDSSSSLTIEQQLLNALQEHHARVIRARQPWDRRASLSPARTPSLSPLLGSPRWGVARGRALSRVGRKRRRGGEQARISTRSAALWPQGDAGRDERGLFPIRPERRRRDPVQGACQEDESRRGADGTGVGCAPADQTAPLHDATRCTARI